MTIGFSLLTTIALFLVFHTVAADEHHICEPYVENALVERVGSESYGYQNVWYKSQAIRRNEAVYRYRYCIFNEHRYTPLYFHWTSDDETYVQTYVPPGKRHIRQKDSARSPATPDDRDFRFGVNDRYEFELEVETVFRIPRDPRESHDAAQSPFNLTRNAPEDLPVTFVEMRGDPEDLDRYLSDMMPRENTAFPLFVSSANAWVPTELRLLSVLMEGGAIEADDNDFYEVVFGVISEIPPFQRRAQLTFFVTIPNAVFSIAMESETIREVSFLVIGPDGTSILGEPDEPIDLASSGRYVQTLELESVNVVPTLPLREGYAGLLVNGSPISVISFEAAFP